MAINFAFLFGLGKLRCTNCRCVIKSDADRLHGHGSDEEGPFSFTVISYVCEHCGAKVSRTLSNEKEMKTNWSHGTIDDLDIVEKITSVELGQIKSKLARYPATYQSLEEILAKMKNGDVVYRIRSDIDDKTGLAIVRGDLVLGLLITGMNL